MAIHEPLVLESATSSPIPSHYRFSINQYEQMEQAGILTENDRVELIRGEIIDKMTIGDRHIACIHGLTHAFVLKTGHIAIVSVQNPVQLPDSVPEPDLVLLRRREDMYASGKARPEDVLLLIEVADTSLDFERNVKLPMYAEGKIQEFWIVNLFEDCLEVYRSPQGAGYGSVRVLRRGEQIEAASVAGVTFAADEILGPRAK